MPLEAQAISRTLLAALDPWLNEVLTALDDELLLDVVVELETLLVLAEDEDADAATAVALTKPALAPPVAVLELEPTVLLTISILSYVPV